MTYSRGHRPESKLVKATPALARRIARDLVECRQMGDHIAADRHYSDLTYIADWAPPMAADAAIHEIESLDVEGWLER